MPETLPETLQGGVTLTKAASLLYQRYRYIALSVYSAVLFAGVVDWLYGGIGPRTIIAAPERWRFLGFAVMVLLLIYLEIRGVGQNSFSTNHSAEHFPFLIRVSLFLGTCLITDLNYSQILFLPVLLYAYLAVNRTLSYVLAVLGVILLLGVRQFDIQLMGVPASSVVDNASGKPANGRGGPPRGGPLIDRSMGALITLFFTLLLARAMTQALRAQQKLTGLLTSLKASHAQLQHYASQIAELATTEERNRLARDIHDGLGHHLAAINIQLEKASAYRDRNPGRAHEAVVQAQRVVQDALKDVRVSVSSLRQSGEQFLFEPSLNDLIRRMRHSGLNIALKQSGDSCLYSNMKLIALYRVIQEGLTNVHKHAGATEATIALTFDLQQVRLVLSDNGQGFDVKAWQASKHTPVTHGLLGLQERLSLLGGILVVESCQKGTTLTAVITQSEFPGGREEYHPSTSLTKP